MPFWNANPGTPGRSAVFIFRQQKCAPFSDRQPFRASHLAYINQLALANGMCEGGCFTRELAVHPGKTAIASDGRKIQHESPGLRSGAGGMGGKQVLNFLQTLRRKEFAINIDFLIKITNKRFTSHEVI